MFRCSASKKIKVCFPLRRPISERYSFLFYLGGYPRLRKFSFQTWLLPHMFYYPVPYVRYSVQGAYDIGC